MKWENKSQVNTNTTSDQIEPAVTALGNGGFVVVRTDTDPAGGDSSPQSVKMQRFEALGQKVGGETQVNTIFQRIQDEPDMVTLADGSYVMVWTD